MRQAWLCRDLDSVSHRLAYTALLRALGVTEPGATEAVYQHLTAPSLWKPYPDTAQDLQAATSVRQRVAAQLFSADRRIAGAEPDIPLAFRRRDGDPVTTPGGQCRVTGGRPATRPTGRNRDAPAFFATASTGAATVRPVRIPSPTAPTL